MSAPASSAAAPAAEPLEDGQIHPPQKKSVAPRLHRGLGLLMAAPCLALLGVAAWLKPDASGLETHRQLGLPACGFHQATGYPCPSCGMTTAFAHAAHGHLWRSWVVQPAGCVLAVVCAMLALVGLWSAASGMNGVGLVGRVLGRKSVLLAFGLLLAAAWGWTVWRHAR